MNEREATSRRPGRPETHGITRLKGAVNRLGARAIDKRTALGKALAAWRADLVADLGGRDAISTQQAAIVDLAVKTKLLLDSIDAWLLTQPSLINLRKRALLPVVRERQQLADALARYLAQLGLERRERPTLSLHEYISEKYGGEPDQKSEVEDRHDRHTVGPDVMNGRSTNSPTGPGGSFFRPAAPLTT